MAKTAPHRRRIESDSSGFKLQTGNPGLQGVKVAQNGFVRPQRVFFLANCPESPCPFHCILKQSVTSHSHFRPHAHKHPAGRIEGLPEEAAFVGVVAGVFCLPDVALLFHIGNSNLRCSPLSVYKLVYFKYVYGELNPHK